MSINTEVAVAWFEQRRGKVTYSMTHRDGPTSYDCSSALYYALRAAGASAASWAVNTESAHNWLIANGYALIAENRDWNMQRGDVILQVNRRPVKTPSEASRLLGEVQDGSTAFLLILRNGQETFVTVRKR